MSPDMIFNLLSKALMQTLQMVFAFCIVGSIIGLPIGAFLATSGKGELFPAPKTNRVLGLIVCRCALDAVHHPRRRNVPRRAR